MSDGDTITAALFNNEYNQLVNAFAYSSSSAGSTGHRHDGTAGHGGNIHTIGDLDFLNKIVADSTNNRWGVFVEVSSAAVEQIRIQDGAIVPVTDNDIDLGTSSLEFKDAYFDGTVTSDAFAGPLTGDVTGNVSGTAATVTTAAQSNITSLGTLTTLTVDNVIINGTTIGHTSDTDLMTLTSGVLTVAGEVDATTLDISGNADIDGTLEADAITVDGTALNEYIADTVGAMVGSNTESGITVAYEDGDNTLDFTVGTLNQDTTGTADNITISANNSTDETVYPIFVDGATGSQGAESDTGLTYNPSSGLLTTTLLAGTLNTAAQGNVTSLGTLTALTVDNVAIDGAVIGHTSDTDLITLSSGVVTVAGEVDATSLDISGNADIDGTLEADAYTVDGTALNEYIADTVGAMVSSNTETNITVTYEDGDNTLDFVIGTLNQDTTGTADNITISANNSTDETVYPIFVDGATGSQGAESDTGLTYNPSTGMLTTTGVTATFTGNITGNVTGNTSGTAATVTGAAQSNITSLGTLTTLTVDNVIVNGTTIGHTSDTDLITLADGNVTIAGELDLTTLDVSGNADIDGTLEADAITVDGTALNEYIADTIGAMVGSNTETGITVTYEDGDNTLDFVIGTLNQDTTGNAATFTATANNSTDETVYPVFVDGATGTQGAETDTGFTYNPSSGLLTIAGELDAGSLDISGNVDIDGTLETDNLTIGGSQGSDGQVLTSTGSGVAWESGGGGGASAIDGLSDAVSGIANFTNSLILGHQTTGTLSSADGNTGVGYAAMDAITSGDNNVAVGYDALGGNTSGGTNTAIGANAMVSNTTASNNVAVGYASLDANTTGAGNTAVGTAALSANTTAANNVAVGYDALLTNTTGTENVAIGYGALDANTTTSSNTAVGHNALGANTAADNTAVGRHALYANTTGASNTAVGLNSLAANTTGTQLVAVGRNALTANTTANNNTAVGYSALAANTTGSENTAMGIEALTANTTATNNSAFGKSALAANTTGTSHVAVGYGALASSTTDTGNTAIGYNALTSHTTSGGGYNVAIGWGALDASTDGHSNVGIGKNALGTLTTADNNTAVGTNALAANTTGDTQTAVGTSALAANTTGAGNTAVGYLALDANTTASYNVAMGPNAAGANTTGEGNTAIGRGALQTNTTGGLNVAIGREALSVNTTASENVAVGTYSMVQNTTGYNNTAVGHYALQANTTANFNTAMGWRALFGTTTGGSNTGFGWKALAANTTGTLNTAVGIEALAANTTANGNTGLGRKALAANTTGANNTAVGADALIANTTGSYNIAIGVTAMDAITTGSEAVAIGYAALTAASGGSNVALGHKAGEDVTTGTNNIFLGKETGRSASPGGSISTGSNEVVIGNNNITEAHIKVDWTVSSDERDKTDFTALDVGLNFINDLEPLTYRWDQRSDYNEDYTQVPDGTHKKAKLDVGFTAQAVEKLEEQYGYKISDETNLTTSLSEDGNQYGLKYSKFVPILVKAIQELSTKVEYLENKLNNK